MTKRKPGAMRGRPKLPPGGRRVLVSGRLLPATIEVLRGVSEDIDKLLASARDFGTPDTRPPAAGEPEPAEDPAKVKARK